jgi:hypothetical protein
MSEYNFATANLSFAFALGNKIGSETKWLEKIAENNLKRDPNDSSSDQVFCKIKQNIVCI